MKDIIIGILIGFVSMYIINQIINSCWISNDSKRLHNEMINIFSDEGLVKFIVNSNMELKDDVIIMIISQYLNSKKTKTEEIGSFTSQLVGALPDQITRITNIIQNLNLQEK